MMLGIRARAESTSPSRRRLGQPHLDDGPAREQPGPSVAGAKGVAPPSGLAGRRQPRSRAWRLILRPIMSPLHRGPADLAT